MNINFPLLLVIVTFVCGLIWAVYALFNKFSGRSVDADQRPPLLVDYAASFFPVLFIVLVLRSFIFEPFRIPSGSMIPTLLVGDFILVNKFSYGVRLPVIHNKILPVGSPETGDVAVFRFPDNPKLDYIKRVVGTPGDIVEYRDKKFTVNGEEVLISGETRYGDINSDAKYPDSLVRSEELGDANHRILVHPLASAERSAGTWKVPEGYYFMVGDNRDNSNDSRIWGFVPEENLVGKACLIWMHWSGGVQWNRIGDRIK